MEVAKFMSRFQRVDMTIIAILWHAMYTSVWEDFFTMTSMNISLPDPMKAFIDEQIKSGAYSSVSEYVRQLIREDQKRAAEAKLEALLLKGLDSGQPIEVTEEYWKNLRARVAQRIENAGQNP